MTIELTLIGKPGCHLCDDARVAIDEVLIDVRAKSPACEIIINEQNILDHAELAKKYSEEIPVLLIDGKMHNYWHIDKDRLRAALDALISKPQYLKNNRCVG
ncbi:MAG: glutaredoxin family protein [Rhodoluna sp.]